MNESVTEATASGRPPGGRPGPASASVGGEAAGLLSAIAVIPKLA
jgi:hypothetical protein